MAAYSMIESFCNYIYSCIINIWGDEMGLP